jgi:formylglycine-generating enzyme required for sulfatase activity
MISSSYFEDEIMSLVGKSVGRYLILEQLGLGGMAIVYKAYDTRLERDVALKVIRVGEIPESQREKLMKRFEREAKEQAKFTHPNIVRVHDYGEYEGSPYLVIEYLAGGTLKAKTGRQMPYSEVARILITIADALAYAHKRNVLHRDVKPSNIMITEEGKPMLGDFGIAKILETEGTALTGTGMGIGTPEYMAPEQWRGEPVPQTDIYALGVVFYELVTGRKPYTADTPTAIALMQAMEPLPRPSELVPDLPEKVEKVLFKALALKPEDRYESMAEFRQVLEELSWEEQASGVVEAQVIPEVPKEPKLTAMPVQESLLDSEPETSDDLAAVSVRVREGKRVSRLWIGLGLLVIALVIAGGIVFLIFGDELAAFQATNTPTVTMVPTQAQTLEPTLGIGSAWERERDGVEMVYIPAGDFKMGSEYEENEGPVHTVYLDAYWIDTYEVTNALFVVFLNEMGNQDEGGVTWLDTENEFVRIHQSEEGWSTDSGYEDHPVFAVSWYGAAAYCAWAGGRLPTEAEWEKAAMGGLTSPMYPWGGEKPTCTLGAENGAQYRDCGGQTVEVGIFAPNGYGVFDMAGNVWEWVADWYDSHYYTSSPTANPLGPSSGDERVLRGGSCDNHYHGVRVSTRNYFTPDVQINILGFRCASDTK